MTGGIMHIGNKRVYDALRVFGLDDSEARRVGRNMTTSEIVKTIIEAESIASERAAKALQILGGRERV